MPPEGTSASVLTGEAGADQTTTTQGAGAAGASGAAGGDPWFKSLPDGLNADPAITKHADLASLAREHVNVQKLIGGTKVAVPGEKATDQDWERVFDALGRPKKPEDYGVKRPDDVPENLWNEEQAKEWSQIAHKAGLLPRQAAVVQGWALNAAKAQAEHIATAAKENGAALRREWAGNFDAKTEAMERGLAYLGLSATVLRSALAAGEGKALSLKLAEIGEGLGEDWGRGGKGGAGAGGAGQNAALAEIAELEKQARDPNSALMNRSHPDHAAVMKRRAELYELAHGAETVAPSAWKPAGQP